MSSTPSTLPPSFVHKKQTILSQLAVPDGEYNDLSPKGSIDVGIRTLIDDINGAEGWVTTSSCAGRVSVFVEGVKKGHVDGDGDGVSVGVEEETEDVRKPSTAGVGGKGGGGHWLFVSHDPVDVEVVERSEGGIARVLGLREQGGESELHSLPGKRLVHFKFEPMILHVLTASLHHAQSILSAALQAGFRESGALNLISSSSAESATPMVAVRSMGLGLESVIGVADPRGEGVCIVPTEHLRGLLEIANERFVENGKRIERFRMLLGARSDTERVKLNPEGLEWEDADARRERKRKEGLERAKALKELRAQEQKGKESLLDDDEDS